MVGESMVFQARVRSVYCIGGRVHSENTSDSRSNELLMLQHEILQRSV